MADVALVIDDEARRVLVQALDLLQRVAMGQWRAISEHAPNVIGPTSPAGFELEAKFARDLAEMEAEHEALSARPERVARAEELIDRIFPDPSVPKGER